MDKFVQKAQATKRKQPSKEKAEQKLLLCQNQLGKRTVSQQIAIVEAAGRALKQRLRSILLRMNRHWNGFCKELSFWASVHQSLVDG
jgi:hypothetical protein